MLYGILAGNKVYLSKIARSLNETITLKKTIDRLSRNLSSLLSKRDGIGKPYCAGKKQMDENHAVIVIDNSDITKPCRPKMKAIFDVHDRSTGEIRKHFTIEAAVLSGKKEMPAPVYEKVLFASEERFVSAEKTLHDCSKSLFDEMEDRGIF